MVTSFLEHVYKKDVSKKVAPPRNFLEYFRFGYVLYTSLFARKAAATSEKSTKHTTKTNKQKREKHYAQIGQASEQCYHQQTLKNVC